MSAVLRSTDAQWEAYYAAVAVTYRAKAETYRCEARAALVDPLHSQTFRQANADRYLARAEEYEQMAREQVESDA